MQRMEMGWDWHWKKSARINRWAYHCREQASERYNFHSIYADCRNEMDMQQERTENETV